MTENGYIKLFRSLLNWEWYEDANVCRIFIHLLLTANFEDTTYKGTDVCRGERATTIEKLSRETKLSVQKVRTAVDKLKRTGELTSKSTNKNTVFSIKNYDLYQSSDKPNNKQTTNKQQTSNKQITNKQQTNNKPSIREEEKEYKEEKKEKEYNNTIAVSSVMSFLLNDGTLYDVLENDVEYYQQLYPGIDVMQELRSLVGWCDANPKNRKTRSGAKRFMNGWLARAQNRAKKVDTGLKSSTREERTMQTLYGFAMNDEECGGIL